MVGVGSGPGAAAIVGELLSLLASLARGRRCVLLASESDARALVDGPELLRGCVTLTPTAAVVWTGERAERIRDWEGAPQPFLSDDGAVLVLPLARGGVAVEDPGYGALTEPGAADLLLLCASLAATALHTAARSREAAERHRALEQTRDRLREQAVLLRDLAVVDELTGLYNRRFLDSRLGYELERLQRYGHPLSVMLFDVDHFKRVNDRHGHLVGDAVLQHLARVGLEAVRRVDLLARFGGEEFAVLLPCTEAHGARIAAERLRERIERTPATTDEGAIGVTISVGVATADGAWQPDVQGLIRAADQALYRAKAGGRNRVVACTAEELA